MNTSFEYIEMCKNAKEIQKLRNYKNDILKFLDGDYYVLIYSLNYIDIRISNDSGDAHMDRFFWLPRQDQLQEILFDKYDLINLFVIFVDWVKGYLASNNERFKEPEFINFNSMEKLWLAFVMKEKYDKIWDKDKKEWILNND